MALRNIHVPEKHVRPQRDMDGPKETRTFQDFIIDNSYSLTQNNKFCNSRDIYEEHGRTKNPWMYKKTRDIQSIHKRTRTSMQNQGRPNNPWTFQITMDIYQRLRRNTPHV